MAAFSDYLENKVLDHIFKFAVYTPETDLFVALCTSTPDDANTTAPAGELSGGGYLRVQCNTWDQAAAGATENTQTVTFPQATADLGTVTHFAICNAITVGAMLGSGALSSPRVISSGDTASFATGDLDVTLD